MDIPQTAENLRYLLWKADFDRAAWARELGSWARCDRQSAEGLLEGAVLGDEVQERVSRQTGVPVEDLQFARLVDAEDVLLENLRYLLGSLEHGQKAYFATAVGIHYTTVSKWYRGIHRPTGYHMERICAFFGLAPSTNLRTDPLFLSLTPVSDLERRAWLIDRINNASAETIEKYFATFQRLLQDS